MGFVCDGHQATGGQGWGRGGAARGTCGHSGTLEAAPSPACLVGALIPH